MGVVVDHVVIAVSDLPGAARYLEEVTGLRAADGGEHTGAGTRNLILLLRSGYLELVTVYDARAAEGHAFGRLVLGALHAKLSLAAWMYEVSEFSEEAVIHQLRRGEQTFELVGLEQSIRDSGIPSLIRRAGAPSVASDHRRQVSETGSVTTPAQDGWEAGGWELGEIQLVGSEVFLADHYPDAPQGSTRLVEVVEAGDAGDAGEASDRADHSARNRIAALVLRNVDGRQQVLDEQTFAEMADAAHDG